jgi:hypothetical protein
MMAKKNGTKQKGRIAAASMSAGATGAIGSSMSAADIERAMSRAVLDAHAEGVTDDAEILKLKLAARERVKAEHRAAMEANSEA